MARIKLSLKEKYPFVCAFDVRVGDLNYGGHVGNSEMVGILHEARVVLFSRMGASEGDLGDGKTGIVMDDLQVNFRAEAFLGETLEVGCLLFDMGRAGFRMAYHVTRGKETVAVAETGLVGFNYSRRVVSFLPESFKKKAAAYTL